MKKKYSRTLTLKQQRNQRILFETLKRNEEETKGLTPEQVWQRYIDEVKKPEQSGLKS